MALLLNCFSYFVWKWLPILNFVIPIIPLWIRKTFFFFFFFFLGGGGVLGGNPLGEDT